VDEVVELGVLTCVGFLRERRSSGDAEQKRNREAGCELVHGWSSKISERITRGGGWGRVGRERVADGPEARTERNVQLRESSIAPRASTKQPIPSPNGARLQSHCGVARTSA
jgi:hypothetical protein